jgi:hypothetical protein
MKKSNLLAIIVFSIISFGIVGSLGTAGKVQVAFGQNNNDDADVKFATNAEMIKGHMAKAIENKDINNLVLAKAHAGHPIEEHYTILEPRVNERNPELNTQLKAALTGLMDKVGTQSSADFKAETEKISKMLDQAYKAVVPESKRGDIKFNANVIIEILTDAGVEYGNGVKGGKIIADIEYQDAQAFRVRANLLFNQVGGMLTAHEKEIAADHFRELEASMNAKEDQSRIQSEITGVANEVREGAGLSASTTDQNQQVDSVQYIKNVKELLKQVSAEYHKGNYTGADQVAVTAYLDNFEHVEGPLLNANQTQLKNDVEQMMRIQLRDMIKQKVTPEQLDAHIAAINVKLDQAVRVVPEFPVGAMVAMSSVIGVVIAASRFGAFRRQGS